MEQLAIFSVTPKIRWGRIRTPGSGGLGSGDEDGPNLCNLSQASPGGGNGGGDHDNPPDEFDAHPEIQNASLNKDEKTPREFQCVNPRNSNKYIFGRHFSICPVNSL